MDDREWEITFDRLKAEYRAALREFQFDFIENRILPAVKREMEDQEALPEDFIENAKEALRSILAEEADESVSEECRDFQRAYHEVYGDGSALEPFERYVLAFLQKKAQGRTSVYVPYSDITAYAREHNAPYTSIDAISKALSGLEKKGFIGRTTVEGRQAKKTSIFETIDDPDLALDLLNNDSEKEDES